MAVPVVCPNPNCHATLVLDPPTSGTALTCEHCGQVFNFTVPEPVAMLTLAGRSEPAATPTLSHAGFSNNSLADPAVTQDHVPVAEMLRPEGIVPAERLSRFEIVRELGEGAFGKVYQARDPQLDRDVALKVAKLDRGDADERVKRFLREAKAAAGLRHPHIVPLYEFGQDSDRFFIASAFIPGKTLKDDSITRNGQPRDLGRAARILRALPEALAYAHGEGIVHRDVKPANVMLDAKDQPLLMDFGLASRQGEAEQLTHAGAVMGTPRYMSPEQAKGRSADAGPASDQYSLGVMLFEMLTGKPLFEGTIELVMYHHQETEPPSPRKGNPAVPRDLETICLKCLEKDPVRRYNSCQELADDLRRWLDGEPVTARPIGPLERVQRWARKNPLSAALTTTVAILLLVGTGVAWGLANWALGEAETAKQQEKEAKDKAFDLAQEQIETKKQLTKARANLFTAQLMRVEAVYEKDPAQGYELLHNCNACPIDLRDFAWGLYAGRCKRDRLTLLGHTAGVLSVAFSPDGKTLAAGGDFFGIGRKSQGQIKL